MPALYEAWGKLWEEDEAPGVGRFGPFLDSGLSNGQEMRVAWAGLQREAVEAAAWLGGDEEVTGPLTVE